MIGWCCVPYSVNMRVSRGYKASRVCAGVNRLGLLLPCEHFATRKALHAAVLFLWATAVATTVPNSTTTCMMRSCAAPLIVYHHRLFFDDDSDEDDTADLR